MKPGACAHPSSFAKRASSSSGLFHSLFDVRFLRLRSSRARILARRRLDARRLGQTGQKLLVNWRLYRAARSSASPRSLPKLWHRWPRACPRSAPRRASNLQHQANTAACVSRSISRRVREIVEWSAWPRQRKCPKAPPAPANPPAARRCRARSNAFEIPYQQRAKVNAGVSEGRPTAAHRT